MNPLDFDIVTACLFRSFDNYMTVYTRLQYIVTKTLDQQTYEKSLYYPF